MGERRAEWVDGKVLILPPDSYQNAILNSWLIQFLGAFIDKIAAWGRHWTFVYDFGSPPRSVVAFRIFYSFRLKECISSVTRTSKARPNWRSKLSRRESESRDWRDKYIEYEKAGVKEYWVIDPASEHFEAYSLGQSGSFERIAEVDQKIHSKVLAGLFVRLAWLWQKPMYRVSLALNELGL